MVLAVFCLAGCTATTHEFAGATLEDPQPVPDFTLTSAEGPVSLSDFRDQYVFLYFGYTFCPDFCPTTLAKLRQVRGELGEDADRMQVLMVSVDPERDTPEVLAEYVDAFDPAFVGLTGTTAEIDAAGEPYGLFYQRNEGSAATGYLVDHTTRTYLIGPDGRALVAYPHDATADAMLADLRWLMEQES
jgi:protein SCO1/2